MRQVAFMSLPIPTASCLCVSCRCLLARRFLYVPLSYKRSSSMLFQLCELAGLNLSLTSPFLSFPLLLSLTLPLFLSFFLSCSLSSYRIHISYSWKLTLGFANFNVACVLKYHIFFLCNSVINLDKRKKKRKNIIDGRILK